MLSTPYFFISVKKSLFLLINIESIFKTFLSKYVVFNEYV